MNIYIKLVSVVAAVTLWVPLLTAQAGPPVPFRVPAAMPDAADLPSPDQVRLEGLLAARVAHNEKNRLLAVNEDELLAGFRHRPGSQDWIGEHVGKFLHAATLAWANTSDPRLREKIDRVAAGLIQTQQADGYLGTYLPKDRWTSWDVWVHKYDLMGLLTYYQYTGDAAALEACRKVGDLLTGTFGPGKRSIIAAGTHVGMAATSVLEPIVLLYRLTGEKRYLDFARYIVAAWDEPNGPKILQTLVQVKSVSRTANGKAYEMMSNLVGLCEVARATGDKGLLAPVVNAWEDVVAHQLYLTGSASHGEHFGKDFDLPNGPGSNICETCVTVTWIQLNAQLLRLTGQARYGDELERSYYNHLAGAQRPDGAAWCYYTPLEGTKPYGAATNCCLSSGPRGMALAPQVAYLICRQDGAEQVAVNLFETSRATLQVGGQKVTVRQQSGFPRTGGSTLTFEMDQPATFGLKVRSPAWAQPLKLRVEGQDPEVAGPVGGWAQLGPRAWKSGDRVSVIFPIATGYVPGEHTNAGRSALTWGPLVLAYDHNRNKALPAPGAVAIVEPTAEMPAALKPVAGQDLAFEWPVTTAPDAAARLAVFVPFAEAGRDGGRFAVWLHTPGHLPRPSLLSAGHESCSRTGNVAGSILDGDPATFVVTFDATARDEDWFAVDLDAPITIRRVAYAHGHCFHDGGWFDASAGKPRVQVRKARNGAWETVGALEDYPATTATRSGGLGDGQRFTLRLKDPLEVFGVRVIGKPACGDNPRQAFASCAELWAAGE